jgi:hypothetical protein
MTYYSTPMLLDAIRLTTSDFNQTVKQITDHFKKSPGGFNYSRAARYQRAALSGFKSFDSLCKQCLGDGKSNALTENAKVFSLIGKLAIGRNAQSFNFPKRSLALAKGVDAPMGPSFFFIEDEVIKLFYLHCRNGHRAELQHLAMLASAFKNEILELEFFGLKADIELLDVGPRDKSGLATITKYNLDDFELPSKEEMKAKMDMFLSAFRHVDENRLAGEKLKPKRKEKSLEDQPSFSF